jgi:membrane-associated protease RseP (regulator of RpoE activity)
MKQSVTRLGIGGAAVFVGLLQIISVAQVRDHPYDGYLAGRDHVVIEVTPGGPAQRAGLRPGDRIIRLGGAAADDSRALDAQPRARIGDTREIIVERGGTPVTLAITFTSLPPIRVIAYLASNLTGISFLAFGLWALIRIPRTSTTLLALAGIGLGAAFVEMPYFESPAARAIQDVTLLPVALFGFVFLLHFTLVFPTPKRILSNRFTLPALYGLPALVAIAYVLGRTTRTGVEPSGWPLLAALVLFMLAFTMSAAALVHSYVNAVPASRSAWGLNFLLMCMVLGMAPIVVTAIALVAPRVVLPGADYYDVVWVLIPVALARAAVRHARTEDAGAAAI